ncbi:hypothetical protein TWF694_004532 [Orbilia ellipsospora]|uniref:Phage protein n=1 Tax=Orbilia ellipsospora TaxID=2528407 RepID=A0AAV9X1K0_9PEZI
MKQEVRVFVDLKDAANGLANDASVLGSTKLKRRARRKARSLATYIVDEDTKSITESAEILKNKLGMKSNSNKPVARSLNEAIVPVGGLDGVTLTSVTDKLPAGGNMHKNN